MENLTAIELLERMVIKGSFLSPADFNEAWRLLKEHKSPVVGRVIPDNERPKLTVFEGSKQSRDL